MAEKGTTPGVDEVNSNAPVDQRPTPKPRNRPRKEQQVPGSCAPVNTQICPDNTKGEGHAGTNTNEYRPPPIGNTRHLAKHFDKPGDVKLNRKQARPGQQGKTYSVWTESGLPKQNKPDQSKVESTSENLAVLGKNVAQSNQERSTTSSHDEDHKCPHNDNEPTRPASDIECNSKSDTQSASLFEAPQCLLSTSKNGQLDYNADVLEQVATLDKNMVVVAVTGMYRTGKSYLLNRLSGENSGFSLGSTIESETKGIWIWVREHPLDSDRYLVLLDTEGLGDAKKGHEEHDSWLFCLATLLSSVLVYNAMGTINEDALTKLSFISDMSKHIRINSDKNPHQPDENFDWYFPAIIFVVRDFSLQLAINGKTVTEDEYLEDCLTLKPEDNERDVRYNKPRKCIRRYFGNRKCFTFDRPAAEREKLHNLDKLKDSDLVDNFVRETKIFCSHVYKKGEVKKLGEGRPLTGRMWATLIKNYIEAIKKGSLPCIENAICAIGDVENDLAMTEALDVYTHQMEKVVLPTPDDKTLSEIHSRAHSAAIKCFLQREIYDKDNQCFTKLNESIGREYEDMIAKNNEASRAKCLAVLEELEQNMLRKLNSGAYLKVGGLREYGADRHNLQAQFIKRSGLGTQANVVLVEYLFEKTEQEEQIIEADKAISEKEREEESERKITLTSNKLQQILEDQKKEDELKLHYKEKAHKLCVSELKEKNAVIEAAENAHREKITYERLVERDRLLQEGFDEEAEKLASTIPVSLIVTPKGNKNCNIL